MSGPVPISIRDAPTGLGASVSDGAIGNTRAVTLAAFGDLILSGEWQRLEDRGALSETLAPLAPLADADLVFANLETTAPGDGEVIEKQPRLICGVATIESVLRALDADIACLGNNHAFDACLGGFRATRALLDRLEIAHLGAGEDLEDASRPLVLERGGLRFGVLAFTDEASRPSHVASATEPGVFALDADDALRRIEALAKDVDHVIVSVHWGVEYCHLPSPSQIRLARSMVDAGARLVIGHHAHVVQGVESWGRGVIAYNLGNAFTTDIAINGRLAIRQSAKTRSTFALRVRFDPEGLLDCEMVPFLAGEGRVRVGDRRARRRLESAQRRLAEGVDERRWKRVRLYEDTVLRTLKKLHPSVIGSVRPRHFVKFFQNLRGLGPAD